MPRDAIAQYQFGVGMLAVAKIADGNARSWRQLAQDFAPLAEAARGDLLTSDRDDAVVLP
jgi:hypothetical protein